MSNIILPNDEFQFDLLHLAHPSSIPGSAYFTKIYCSGKPLYVQTPKSFTKQGFVKNGKKIYSELMFDNNEPVFIRWLENLETKCHEMIYEKGDEWFQEKMEKSDIETAFTSPIRIYRSGKNYLLRTNVKINHATNIPIIKIYNENEVPLKMDDITHDKQIISVIEIQGIKFTSRSFQIEIEMKQVMVLDNDMLFDKCVIDTGVKHLNNPVIKCKTVDKIQIPKEEEEEEEEEVGEMDINSDEEDDSVGNTMNFKPNKNVNELCKEEPKIDETMTLIEDSLEKDTPSEFSDFSEISMDLEAEQSDVMKLKKPEEVYYEVYRLARKKARRLKHQALLAFLEAKNIKKTYMLDDLEEDDSVISELDFKHIEEILNYNMEEI